MNRINELKIGNLYKGTWFAANDFPINKVYLHTEPTMSSILEGYLCDINCFVLLEVEQGNTDIEYWCKVITYKGEVGWALFNTKGHYFEELKDVCVGT